MDHARSKIRDLCFSADFNLDEIDSIAKGKEDSADIINSCVNVSAGSNRQLSRPTGRPTNIMSSTTSVNGHGESVSGLTGRRELENIPPTPTSTVTQCNLMTPVQNRQQKQQAQQQQQQQQQQLQQQQAQVENGRSRRSNVVKEVERLKKNREERRQRQAELKEEKEALMNMDPGNPNWEFLAMIRLALILSALKI